MSDYYQKVVETSEYLSDRISETPKVAIVLGSGLGTIQSKMQIVDRIPYSEIPHFPDATVKGHAGELVIGHIHGLPVVAQSGRYHYYEGYDMKTVTFPVRSFKLMGVNTLFIASAVGGIHEDYEAGDVTVVNDHINLFGDNPLRGPNDERFGPRFPDMSEAYDKELIGLCHQIAGEKNIRLFNSVYAGLQGPNLETKSEYDYLHRIGATVVGMSTVPEVIVARHMDMRVCVLTAVTNKCFPVDVIGEVSHDDVIEVAAKAGKHMSIIFEELIEKVASD